MRRAVALLTMLSAAVGLLAVPLAGTAAAGTCAAVAVPPHVILGEIYIFASGEFRCAEPATGMTVTVCIEELEGGLGSGTWVPRDCGTTVAEGPTDTVSHETTTFMPVYATYLRTTVVGANDAGDQAGTKSPPVFWFNCACYIG